MNVFDTSYKFVDPIKNILEEKQKTKKEMKQMLLWGKNVFCSKLTNEKKKKSTQLPDLRFWSR